MAQYGREKQQHVHITIPFWRRTSKLPISKSASHFFIHSHRIRITGCGWRGLLGPSAPTESGSVHLALSSCIYNHWLDASKHPLLQAKQPQIFLMGGDAEVPSSFLWPHVSHMLGSPEQDTKLQVWSHQCWALRRITSLHLLATLLTQPKTPLAWMILRLPYITIHTMKYSRWETKIVPCACLSKSFYFLSYINYASRGTVPL